jgi:hypothetical protein
MLGPSPGVTMRRGGALPPGSGAAPYRLRSQDAEDTVTHSKSSAPEYVAAAVRCNLLQPLD